MLLAMTTCPACGGELTGPTQLCVRCSPSPSAPVPDSTPAPLFSAILNSDAQLRGIGGWLVLVAIGRVIGPLVLLYAIGTGIAFLAKPGRVHAEEVIPGVTLLIAMQVVTSVVMFLADLYLLVLFFREKKSFPRYFQICLACYVVIALALLTFCPHSVAWGVVNPTAIAAVAKIRTSLVRAAMESFFSAAVWISYFSVSHRVKVTFVN